MTRKPTPEEHAAWLASLHVPQSPTTGVGAFFGRWPIMTLSDRLRRMLDDRGCSIAEAARLAGMERQQVWRIVTGKNVNPGVETVRKIVEAVGGTMAELFADEE